MIKVMMRTGKRCTRVKLPLLGWLILLAFAACSAPVRTLHFPCRYEADCTVGVCLRQTCQITGQAKEPQASEVPENEPTTTPDASFPQDTPTPPPDTPQESPIPETPTDNTPEFAPSE